MLALHCIYLNRGINNIYNITTVDLARLLRDNLFPVPYLRGLHPLDFLLELEYPI